MAESDSPTPAPEQTPDTPQPPAQPRRRRAAQRPAGPPPVVEQVEVAQPLTTIAAPQPAVAVVVPEPAAAPARRRRAAGRPAGPPVEVPAAGAEPTDAAPLDAQDAEAAVAGDIETAVSELAEAVEPSAVDDLDADAAPLVDHVVDDADPADDADLVVEAELVDGELQTVTDAEADLAVAAVEVSEEDLAQGAEPDAPRQAALADDTEPGERPARRRRSSRRRRLDSEAAESEQHEAEAADAEASDEHDTPDDEVAASLAALEKSRGRGRRRGRRSSDEQADDVAAALDDLAAALGDDERTTQDEDADEAEELVEGDEASDDEQGDDEGGSRRRRRRRGGRRRRRSERDDDETTEDEASEADDEEDDSDETEGDDNADDAEVADKTPSRRRRRRRRRGEDSGDEATEDGVDVVVKVRDPHKGKAANDQITSIEGSTRMEAKKQRRREGRAAGRRRAPILSEAEFLARRESVERVMVIRQREEYTQVGVLEDGVLVEHYVDRDSSASMIGNVYLGRVQNVLPSMEAAFVDIGRGRNAVLYAGEVDWDSFGATGADRKVEKVLKSGQAVLVQVTKDPVGAKGARLTSHISIPGRYVVYSPGGQLSGISRKLPENERARLKGILDDLVGENASVIVRTAAEGASEDELVRDVNRLKAQWEVIEKKVAQGNSPQMLYTEPDLTVRIVRDLFTEDFAKLIIDGNGEADDVHDTVQAYVQHVAPHLAERIEKWNRWTQGDLFAEFRVDEQISKALERKVHLPSGGSLVIDRTEAMTVIDVNTGKFTGNQGNLEATVTSNNLEAAEEVVRQLRLRDIGGIIVIDFIDMVLPANRELLLRRLVECLGRDRTRHQVAEVTSLGLVQMTRKKIGTGLAEAFTVPCENCDARGYHVHQAPVASQAPADGGDREHGRRHRKGGSGQSNG